MFCLDCVISWKVAELMKSHLWQFEQMRYIHPEEWTYTYRFPSTTGTNGLNVIASDKG